MLNSFNDRRFISLKTCFATSLSSTSSLPFTNRPFGVCFTSWARAMPMWAIGSSHLCDRMIGIGSPDCRQAFRVLVYAPGRMRSPTESMLLNTDTNAVNSPALPVAFVSRTSKDLCFISPLASCA
jgi:hypothetical protein